MRARAVVLAVAIVMAPLGARAADLVVWWEQGFYPQEDAAVAEIIAAFEQETGKQVELVQPTQDEISAKSKRRSRPGSRPISCSARIPTTPTANLFDPDALGYVGPLERQRGSKRGKTMRRLGMHLSPSMVIACVALLVALGSVGVAAIQFPANSVGRLQLRTNSANSANVANGTLQAIDFARNQLPAGPAG